MLLGHDDRGRAIVSWPRDATRFLADLENNKGNVGGEKRLGTP